MGVRKVWAVLRREEVRASHKRVYAVMKALGLLLPPIRERDTEVRRGRVVTATSNRRWASDLTTTWTRLDGLVALVPVIVCGDRGAFEIGVTRSQEAPTVLAPVGRPTGNAVTERFIQTMKVELLWIRDWESIEELRAAVAEWLVEYNERRPHQALAWQTPAERRAQNLAAATVAVA